MEYIIVFGIIFIILFLINYLFIYYLNRKNEDLSKIKSYRYVVNRYKLKMNKQKTGLLIKYLTIINSLIIAIPLTVIMFIDINFAVLMIVSFFSYITLMLVSYNLLGKCLKKKGW